MMEMVVTTGAVRRAKLQSKYHRQTPPSVLQAGYAMPVAQPTVSEQRRDKMQL